MEFIQSALNLRAQNYYIEPSGYNKALMVVGRIIQVLPNTITIVSGYLSLQLMTLINSQDIEKQVQNANLDLSCNMFFNFSPSKYIPKPKPDPIKVNKSMISQEFIDFSKNEHNFDDILSILMKNLFLYEKNFKIGKKGKKDTKIILKKN